MSHDVCQCDYCQVLNDAGCPKTAQYAKALRTELEQVRADNAALVERHEQSCALCRRTVPASMIGDCADCKTHILLSQPHPGDPLRTELGRIEEENNLLWAILKTCPGCTRFVPGVVHGCEMQAHIDLSGHCNQREELKGK